MAVTSWGSLNCRFSIPRGGRCWTKSESCLTKFCRGEDQKNEVLRLTIHTWEGYRHPGEAELCHERAKNPKTIGKNSYKGRDLWSSEDSVKGQKSNSWGADWKNNVVGQVTMIRKWSSLGGALQSWGLGEPMVSERHQRQGWGENPGVQDWRQNAFPALLHATEVTPPCHSGAQGMFESLLSVTSSFWVRYGASLWNSSEAEMLEQSRKFKWRSNRYIKGFLKSLGLKH